MDFSSLQKISQTSITLMKVNPEQDPKRIRPEQNKCIRVNRKKLPSDFFRVSIEKKLIKKQSVEHYSNKINNQITLFQVKQTLTQRKVCSHKFLSNSETNPITEINTGRWSAFKAQNEQQKILQRKLLERQPFETKSVDLTKLKPPKQKHSHQKINLMDNVQGITQRKGIKYSTQLVEKDQTAQFGNFIDLGCTFGCGFNNKMSFTVENCPEQRQNSLLNPYEHERESTSQDSPNKINFRNLYKSTQYQELDAPKNKQNSPIKQIKNRKILEITELSHQFDRSKLSPVQKNIINQDLMLFDNLCIEDPKIVLGGTNDQKPLNLRKDKRNDSVNLPKIGKKVSLTEKMKC